MSLERNEQAITDAGAAVKTVRLAGRDFVVAPLTLRAVLGLAEAMPKLSGITAANFASAHVSALGDAVWHGLRRTYPNLAREEFFDLPISVVELVAAFPVIVAQAGGQNPEAVAGE